jgi:alpha-1,3-glucosyltransferase
MFGWHVHEKAILMVILPLSLIALENAFQSRMFVVLSTVGHYSLFPLLFLPSGKFTSTISVPKRVINSRFHQIRCLRAVRWWHHADGISIINHLVNRLTHQPRWNIAERLLLIGLIAVQIFFSVVHPLLYKQLEFLPLLITSVYCALGVTYFWAVYYVKFMRFTTAAED